MMMPGGSNIPAQFMPSDGVSTPTSSSAGPTSVGGGNNAGGMPDGGPLSNMLNGESADLKQSPASVHGGSNVNGGTPGGGHGGGPGSHLGANAGPGSVAGGHGPGSVQSQSGAPNSVAAGPQHSQQQNMQSGGNPGANEMLMDFPSSGGGDEAQEISKIKASLIEDFATY
jgi:hypothetical protein